MYENIEIEQVIEDLEEKDNKDCLVNDEEYFGYIPDLKKKPMRFRVQSAKIKNNEKQA